MRSGYIVQFYREEVGDIGIDDAPILPGQDYEKIARAALLSYVNNKMISPAQCPLYARVTSPDSLDPLVTLMATGFDTVERV